MMISKNIIKKSVRSEAHNSNNAWGFGGKAGKYYYFENPDLSFFRGLYCYRHAPSERVESYYYKGQQIEKEEFLELLNKS